jgi:hypothetical protein
MRDDWTNELLKASERSDVKQESTFLALVDEACGRCTVDVARTLMRTFSAKPDYGTQERVRSVLASAEPVAYLRAMLEELPRLAADAPEWAEALLGEAVEFMPDVLERTANSMPATIRLTLRGIIGRPDFRAFYPKSDSIKVSPC